MTGIQKILLSALALFAVQTLAAEVAGVKVDERIRLGSSELVLNGAGLRTKAFFKVYVAGLYLAEKRTSTADVLALPGAKREAKGKAIVGEDFYRALLRIWLGDNPVSGSLKKALLGQGG